MKDMILCMLKSILIHKSIQITQQDLNQNQKPLILFHFYMNNSDIHLIVRTDVRDMICCMLKNILVLNILLVLNHHQRLLIQNHFFMNRQSNL